MNHFVDWPQKSVRHKESNIRKQRGDISECMSVEREGRLPAAGSPVPSVRRIALGPANQLVRAESCQIMSSSVWLCVLDVVGKGYSGGTAGRGQSPPAGTDGTAQSHRVGTGHRTAETNRSPCWSVWEQCTGEEVLVLFIRHRFVLTSKMMYLLFIYLCCLACGNLYIHHLLWRTSEFSRTRIALSSFVIIGFYF